MVPIIGTVDQTKQARLILLIMPRLFQFKCAICNGTDVCQPRMFAYKSLIDTRTYSPTRFFHPKTVTDGKSRPSGRGAGHHLQAHSTSAHGSDGQRGEGARAARVGPRVGVDEVAEQTTLLSGLAGLALLDALDATPRGGRVCEQ